MKIIPPDKSPSAELAMKRIDQFSIAPHLVEHSSGGKGVALDYETFVALRMIERLIYKGNKK